MESMARCTCHISTSNEMSLGSITFGSSWECCFKEDIKTNRWKACSGSLDLHLVTVQAIHIFIFTIIHILI